MSEPDPIDVRLELARLHWSLGEHAEAENALARVASEAPDHPGLARALERFAGEARTSGLAELAARLEDRLVSSGELKAVEEIEPSSAIATPTLAKLLAEQGHPERARAVGDTWLRRNPGNERASELEELLPGRSSEPSRQIAEHERWLQNDQAHKRQGAQS